MIEREKFNAWVNEAPNQRYGGQYFKCWQACAEQKDKEIAELKARCIDQEVARLTAIVKECERVAAKEFDNGSIMNIIEHIRDIRDSLPGLD